MKSFDVGFAAVATPRLIAALVVLLAVSGCGEQMPEIEDEGVKEVEEPERAVLMLPDAFGEPTRRGPVVEYNEIDGRAVAGDIVFPERNLKPLDEIESSGAGHEDGMREYRLSLHAEARSVWPEGHVPYVIDPELPDKSRVTEAIAEWNAKTPLEFVERDGEKGYVRFTRAEEACRADFGWTGAEQFIYLSDRCGRDDVIHEIGHTAGLFHEHNRADRDEHVDIRWDNIEDGYAAAFRKQTGVGMNFGDYDVRSIMHYPSDAFARDDGKPTIVRKSDGDLSDVDRRGLSPGDVDGIRQLYEDTSGTMHSTTSAEFYSPASGATQCAEVTRMAGRNRYETAVDISQALYPSGADKAVLVRGEGRETDALVAGPLAASLGAPILLTGRDQVPDVTFQELRRLEVKSVHIVGSSEAICGDVKSQIKGLEDLHDVTVGRIGEEGDGSCPSYTGEFVDDDRNVHEAAIDRLAEEGVANGCSDGPSPEFCPGQPVTRGQFALFLDRALDLQEARKDHFTDDDGSPWEDAVNRLAAAGFAKGCTESGDDFCPQQTLKRRHAAALLDRVFGFPSADRDFFADDDGEWYEEHVDDAAAADVINGCGATEFCPDADIRRDQVASLICRAKEDWNCMDSSRFETAERVAQKVGTSDENFAYIASGSDSHLVDGLAASGAAGGLGAPILLVTHDSIPPATRTALDDLGIERTAVLGGKNAISEGVEHELPGATRIAGETRYGTAAAIASDAIDRGLLPRAVNVARGGEPADALAAGASGQILLLSSSESLPEATRSFIDEHVSAVNLLGGSAALSETVETEVCRALGVEVGTPGGSGGDSETNPPPLKFEVIWEGTADIDIHVETPNGEVVGPSNPSTEFGNYIACEDCDNDGTHFEAVLFEPAAQAPTGEYEYWVTNEATEEVEVQLLVKLREQLLRSPSDDAIAPSTDSPRRKFEVEPGMFGDSGNGGGDGSGDRSAFDIKAIQPDGADKQELADHNTGGVALNLIWSQWEPTRVTDRSACDGIYYEGHCFDLHPTDAAIRRWTELGVEVTAVVYGVPKWARLGACKHKQEVGHWCAPKNSADYGRFAGMLADRYDGSGNGRIANFVIHNEVTSNGWYNVGCGKGFERGCDLDKWIAKYTEDFNAAYDAIKEHIPEAKVLTSFTQHFGKQFDRAHLAYPETKISIQTFLTRFAAGAGNREWQVAVHPYPHSLHDPDFGPEDFPRVTFGNIGRLVGWLRKTFPNRPHAWRIQLTEQGISSMRPRSNESDQATGICNSFRNVLGTPGIGNYVYHRYKDNEDELMENNPDAHGLAFGLVDKHGNRKKAWPLWATMNQTGSLKCGFEHLPHTVLTRYKHPKHGHWASTRRPPSGSTPERTFRLFRSDQPGADLRMLYECGRNERDSFVSKDPDCLGRIARGPLGYAYAESKNDTVALYRCKNGNNLFISRDCEGEGAVKHAPTPLGWVKSGS